MMFGSHSPDLKCTGPLLLDGEPVLCPSCGAPSPLFLNRCGSREVWPARLGCLNCGHAEDHDRITNGLLEAALAACTGRSRAADRDTFAAQWRGLLLEGERYPEFVFDDAVVVVKELRKEGKKRARRWWRTAKKQAAGKAGQASGGVKARVLGAAWRAQTGGAGPVRRPGRRCRVKGCKRGVVAIKTRLHSPDGKARKVQVPCGLCHRA